MKLVVENLSKKYGKKQILKDINFTFENNKIYGIVGRNGVGKTTFFQILNKDIDYNSGSIKIDDNDINDHNVSFVPATPNVPAFLTGREFLSFFLEINKDKIKNLKTIDEYFDMVDIKKEDQYKIMKEYSTGMKNKIQTLLGIISEKEVLLLDEPLTSLDIVVQEEMKNLLKKVKKDRITIVTTHILDIAIDLCDEILILKDEKFELIEKKDLNNKKYKTNIINALKDNNNDK
ncbi:MAG: ABC transporter ATP-binding protein [Bacilli bacterium]|nr:ABC transporter ATP-binding protein [Bacilli bacterium]